MPSVRVFFAVLTYHILLHVIFRRHKKAPESVAGCMTLWIIFQLIDAAMNYIVRNIRWRVNLSEDGIHRTETPEIPIEVLREANINSFAHARYDIPVRHEIDIYSNRISIINPGAFANEFTPQDYASRDLHSFLRNEAIAKTLYLCKDVETFGSGIKKIYRLCAENDVRISYTNTDNDFMISFQE